MAEDFTALSDEELAGRAQAGSLVCFEALALRYEAKLFHFLRLRTGQTQDAEDLTQATLIRAYRKLRHYRSRHRFATWLFTIARRLLATHYRGRRPCETLDAEPVDTSNAAEAVAADDELAYVWRRAAEHLPKPQYTALWLRYTEDLSIREIAAVLGTSTGNVKVLLHRARQAVADLLGGSSPGADRSPESSRATTPTTCLLPVSTPSRR